MDAPKYSYPPGVLAAPARDLLLSQGRDFHRDAQACIAGLNPALQIIGKEYIPQRGPCVITVNHYYRDGFGAKWLALAIAFVDEKDRQASQVIMENIAWLLPLHLRGDFK